MEHPLKEEGEADSGVPSPRCGLSVQATLPASLSKFEPPELSFGHLKSPKLLVALGRDWAVLLLVIPAPSPAPKEEINQID